MAVNKKLIKLFIYNVNFQNMDKIISYIKIPYQCAVTDRGQS